MSWSRHDGINLGAVPQLRWLVHTMHMTRFAWVRVRVVVVRFGAMRGNAINFSARVTARIASTAESHLAKPITVAGRVGWEVIRYFHGCRAQPGKTRSSNARRERRNTTCLILQLRYDGSSNWLCDLVALVQPRREREREHQNNSNFRGMNEDGALKPSAR